MNAEQMELARRFVACKGGVWLEGMVACDSSRPLMWRRRLLSQGEIFGWKFDAVSGPVPRGPWRSLMVGGGARCLTLPPCSNTPA